MLNMLPGGSLNSSEQGVLKGETWELIIWRDGSKILSHFPAISQPLLKEVSVYLQPRLCFGKRNEWYTIKGIVVWILSGCTFISFIWDASVHTLLWNSIINHWVSEREMIICTFSQLNFSPNFSLKMLFLLPLAAALKRGFCWKLSIFITLIALFMLQITDLVFEKLPCLGQQSF